jgi:methyl-accepting chemotaxis protein
MAMLKRMSISSRLMLFLPVLLAALCAIVLFGMAELRDSLVNDRKAALKDLVHTAMSVVKTWHEREALGQVTAEQAQTGARNDLWRLRFGDNNYFFVQRYDGVTMVQFNRELEGKNRLDVTDVDGVPTVRLQIEAARRGGDYISYRNPRTGGITANTATQDFLPKLSYCSGFDPWQWAVCTGIYIDDVDVIYNHILMIYGAMALFVVLITISLAFVIARSISQPMSVITERMAALADGEVDVEVPFLGEGHEVGQLARALHVFKLSRRKTEELTAAQQSEQTAKLRRQERLERIVGDFHQRTTRIIEAVARAAEQVQAHARNLAQMANHSRSNVAVVSHAASETTSNVQAVAGAAEELSAAVGDVNRRVVKATDTVRRAVDTTDRTNATMHGLVDAAKRIGTIVQVIQDIASQTNLLALNATIEAARAGEAGKGFAVVASEVKSLANQTTKATEEIETQVGAIQAETERAVEAISNIGTTVDEMSEMSTAIATAMEEQGATTQEIARNIGQVADSTKEVSSNIAGVSSAAENTSHAAGELQKASDELRSQASVLEQEMKGFLGEMRAA